MLKIAIIGCGKIADAHAGQIARIPNCEIVAGCDRELLMAQQFSERFGVKQSFNDLKQMLAETRPDVVHITTPPESHVGLAKACLEAGSHVYVEKPFTLYADETEELIELANRKGLKITAGHDDQFSHAARRMRALVKDGYLGGNPVHMESYYCYEMGKTGYAGALLGDKRHWVRRLPGKLLHNIISHGIARIAEFLTTDSPRIIAHGFVSPFLRELGEDEIIDELRVIINENDCRTAYFTFSSQMRPIIHQFRIYGPKGGLVVDPDYETLIKLRGQRYTSYVEKVVPALSLAKQNVANAVHNVRHFLARDFHMKSGMKFLIENFYRSITDGAPLPIPYEEIVRTAKIMDAIFAQIYERQGQTQAENLVLTR